jgi:hypothetical protein
VGNNSSTANYADGIDGVAVTGSGVAGGSTDGNGVSGTSVNGYGVSGLSFDNDAVHALSTTGRAGYFNGDVVVTGTCCGASTGTYKIDDPLDPANKYLYQSAVVSQDMMSVYNGNATLDSKGEAWVQLPDWFAALTGEYRYQLTCLGGYAPVYIAHEIENNSIKGSPGFEIAGGTTGLKVSWQVTGVRHDPYALAHPVVVEQDKPAGEQGTYLHPTELGQPESTGVDYAERQQLAEKLAGH